MSVANKRPFSVQFIATAFLMFWLVLAAFPFLWTLWGSFKVEGDFFSKADWAQSLRGTLTQVETGGTFTGGGYFGAWVQEGFGRSALNTFVVCVAVVTISLTFGTLGGYALSRSNHRYAFWFLLFALIFRAMPPLQNQVHTTHPLLPCAMPHAWRRALADRRAH